MTRQTIWKRLLMLVAILMLGSLVLAACGDDEDDADPTNTSGTAQPAATNTTGAAVESPEPSGEAEPVDYSGLSGEINIDGSSTVFPVAQAVSEEFLALAPDVDFAVNASGTGGGFEKFCAGETDISDASRPIENDEIALCEQNGVDYTEFQVGVDGLSVVVNIENDWIECITTDQLALIWGPDSTVKNWSDVDASWPNEPIDLYGPGTDSGTFDYFTGEINGEEGASRADYTASEDDNVLVTGIAGNTYAMGYFGYAYYAENQDTLKVLGVDSGSGCVTPNPETVASNEYAPLSRPLFMYIAHDSIVEKPEVAAFVEFILSDQGQAIVPEVGYVALNNEQRSAERADLADVVQ
ncbi:MAG TPA: PstS family phosphate ABC transporter substrate-binding protein [Thermomicrobiales bacterium]|nr:PstS family phosphate ABC transporter substrate-binding protein [Thermomicrobiales bacterium]